MSRRKLKKIIKKFDKVINRTKIEKNLLFTNLMLWTKKHSMKPIKKHFTSYESIFWVEQIW